MEDKLTISALQQMKRDGRKIVGVVAWDTEMARIADRAGVDLVSVGDSVGVNLWGHATDTEVTVDEMLICCKAVRRGAKRVLVSCDVPNGPVQAGTQAAVGAAVRLAKGGGADMVKVLGDPGMVKAVVRAGVPVFAEFHGGKEISVEKLVEEAKRLEDAGASLLDFRHSGPVAGAAAVRAVSIPVIGGLGGGPWLDGRIRMAHAAIGYAASNLESKTETYANVARITLDAITAYADDVRAGRHLKGQRPA
ncbi:MAG TPA: 3-methyl-2-oxobutanoate hydroxymethyltransferase [Burkholderiales bacterium]|nr:3-methyl-2-oxobutanoate hydroxymethyltransferase [Burkholderiales bacterium]